MEAEGRLHEQVRRAGPARDLALVAHKVAASDSGSDSSQLRLRMTRSCDEGASIFHLRGLNNISIHWMSIDDR